MTKEFPGERWKTIVFDFEYTNQGRIEVSNFGRIRTFNKVSDGKLLAGSMINGYKILRLKLYAPRPAVSQKKFDFLQRQVNKLADSIKQQTALGDKKASINANRKLLDSMKNQLSEKFRDDLKARTIHQHFLFHRLVAAYFLPKPAASKTIVGHLDYNKLNNRANNLKWMTPEENLAHQQNSPYVIAEKQDRAGKKERSGATKLTVTKVMLIKKLLAEAKPARKLAKQFKVSEMQIFRIKKGENWSEVKAAR